jgi:transposase
MQYNVIMKLTKTQYRKIEHLMPIPRKPAEISNYQFMCALLYIIENGCKWRALPKKYGKWHTIYMKFNRWSKNGTMKKIFEKMQELNIIDVRTDTLCIDSTSIKVHPDAAGARKSSGEQSIGRSKGG